MMHAAKAPVQSIFVPKRVNLTSIVREVVHTDFRSRALLCPDLKRYCLLHHIIES